MGFEASQILVSLYALFGSLVVYSSIPLLSIIDYPDKPGTGRGEIDSIIWSRSSFLNALALVCVSIFGVLTAGSIHTCDNWQSQLKLLHMITYLQRPRWKLVGTRPKIRGISQLFGLVRSDPRFSDHRKTICRPQRRNWKKNRRDRQLSAKTMNNAWPLTDRSIKLIQPVSVEMKCRTIDSWFARRWDEKVWIQSAQAYKLNYCVSRKICLTIVPEVEDTRAAMTNVQDGMMLWRPQEKIEEWDESSFRDYNE